MAEVFRALAHGMEGFERIFVVKRIRPDKSDSPKFVQMFVEEARISALLNHPNIVQVYDFGADEGGERYLVTELVRGPHLGQWLESFRASGSPAPSRSSGFTSPSSTASRATPSPCSSRPEWRRGSPSGHCPRSRSTTTS